MRSQVRLKYGPLTIALTRGTYALHYVGKPIVIDANPSYDPDDPTNQFAPLEARFTCRDVTFNQTCFGVSREDYAGYIQAPHPRHFDGIRVGRKRVSDTCTHKNSGSCTYEEGAQPLFHALFWRQNTASDAFSPAFNASGLRGQVHQAGELHLRLRKDVHGDAKPRNPATMV